jgi:hypothetical protein
MTQPKFEIGQKVTSPDGEVCEILKISFDGENWSYVVSSKEVSVKERKIVDGVKSHLESELKEIKSKEPNV